MPATRRRGSAPARLRSTSPTSRSRDVFVRREFFNRAWGLPLYYGAQVCIAIAASR
ncbi:MAG: hypothetical protein IPN32_35465 [Deltaproteobacteria bacterium]|nr:hypothetical protein [Deltaproteobacteria bacterium]